ncbi:MAG: heparan-alpha-glucosaminide N-acetyltransferase domain-containing protein [Kineosporiaceae bacterium]
MTAPQPLPAGTRRVGPATARLLGVDAARGIALLGMMVIHIVPSQGETGAIAVAYDVAHGRASALFAVLAGMSLVLADGGARGPVGGYGTMLARAAVRAVLIGVVGLLLAMAGTPILVILTYYGLLFLLASPLIRLPAAVLAGLALGWAVLGPVVSHAVRSAYGLEQFLESPSFDALADDPGRVVTGLLLTGTYPALTWLAYALAGAALGRAALGGGGLLALAGGGLALAAAALAASTVLVERGRPALDAASPFTTVDGSFYGTTPTDSWWWLVIARPHSGTPFDMLATIGSSVLVVAIMLLVVRGRTAPAWIWLTAAGSMTLSLYSAHVVMVALGVGEPAPAAQVWLLQAAIVLLAGLAWRALLRRGPLEALVGRTVDLVAPQRRVSAGGTASRFRAPTG